jgi:hypothetical protein
MASKARKTREALLKCFLTDDLNEFMLHKRRIPGALKNEAPMSPMSPVSPVLIGKHTKRLLERTQHLALRFLFRREVYQ